MSTKNLKTQKVLKHQIEVRSNSTIMFQKSEDSGLQITYSYFLLHYFFLLFDAIQTENRSFQIRDGKKIIRRRKEKKEAFTGKILC